MTSHSMSIIGAHITSSARQIRSGERQSWQVSSIWQGGLFGKRLQLVTAAVLRARESAESKSGHSLFAPAIK